MSENCNDVIQETTPEVQAAPIEPVAPPESTNALFNDAPRKPVFDPIYVPSLVLGILSIVLGLLIPLVGEILGIIGISKAVKNRWEHRITAGLTCSIIGLVLSVVNHVLGIILTLNA